MERSLIQVGRARGEDSSVEERSVDWSRQSGRSASSDTVGERTEANGFTKGYIINDGILVQDLGGGVSQMATTTFNAMFFAGLKDIQHKPHSFYIDRYPVGREATVAELAEHSGLSIDEATCVWRMSRQPVSLDQPVGDEIGRAHV